MLVLSRKRGQKTTLTCANGDVVIVEIVEVRGSIVRVGFTAPEGVNIERDDAVEKGSRPHPRPCFCSHCQRWAAEQGL